MAALLLDAGSNIHAQDVVMNTSLHYVVSAEYAKEIKLELLNILLCYGANSMILGKDDDTAIDAAHANYFLDGIELMKERLGKVTMCCSKYMTVLVVIEPVTLTTTLNDIYF